MISRSSVLVVDALCVLVFAAVGRSSHEEGVSVVGLLSTAWPFLVGLAAASYLAHRWSRPGDAPWAVLPWGWTIPVVTWALGMVLRVASGQGVSGAFPLVALGFLVLVLLGWRLLAAGGALVRRRGPRRSVARANGTPGHGG